MLRQPPCRLRRRAATLRHGRGGVRPHCPLLFSFVAAAHRGRRRLRGVQFAQPTTGRHGRGRRHARVPGAQPVRSAMTYRHWLTSIVIGALILLALAACTSSPPQPPPGPSTLEVQPPEGPPGTFITITGLSSEAL